MSLTISEFFANYWAILLFAAVLVLLIKIKHKIKKTVFLAILIGAGLFASGITVFNFK